MHSILNRMKILSGLYRNIKLTKTIDKAYTLFYELDKVGRILKFSSFHNYSTSDAIIHSLRYLPLPNKDGVINMKNIGGNVSLQELLSIVGIYDVSIYFKENIKNKETFESNPDMMKKLGQLLDLINEHKNIYVDVNENDEIDEDINTFVELINKHQNFRPTSAGVKNKIVYLIYETSSDIANLEASTQPMAADIITKEIDEVENEMANSLDGVTAKVRHSRILNPKNPYSKIVMQRRSAIGKQEVGIFANGQKTFSLLTQYFNDFYGKKHSKHYLENELEFKKMNVGIKDSGGNAVKGLKFTLPNGKIIEKNIITRLSNSVITNEFLESIGNNLEESVKKYIPNITDFEIAQINGIIRTETDSFVRSQKINEILRDYIDNSEYVAADILSVMISLATDNAKELALGRMNCTLDTAKGVIAMIVLGFSPKEVVEISMQLFGIITEKLDENRWLSTKRNNSKNKIYNAINRSKKEFDDDTRKSLISIFKVGDELTSISKFLKINGGLKARLENLELFLSHIDRMIHDKCKALKDNVLFKNADHAKFYSENKNIFEGIRKNYFDLDLFLYDGNDYNKLAQKDKYVKALKILFEIDKEAFNIIDVILNSGYYYKMLKAANKSCEKMKLFSAKYRYIRYCGDPNNNNSIIAKDDDGNLFLSNLSLQENQDFDTEEEKTNDDGSDFRGMNESSLFNRSLMYDHYVIGEWLKDLKYKYTFSESSIYRSLVANGIIVDGVVENVLSFFDIGNNVGLKIFMDVMELYIPYLKNKYVYNQYLQHLSKQTTSNKMISYEIDKDSFDDSLFDEYLKNDIQNDFKQLCRTASIFKDVNGRSITDGELLYLYDIIAHKKPLGKQSYFTQGSIDSVLPGRYDGKIGLARSLTRKYQELDSANNENESNVFRDLIMRLYSLLKSESVYTNADRTQYIKINPKSDYIYTFVLPKYDSELVNGDQIVEYLRKRFGDSFEIDIKC